MELNSPFRLNVARQQPYRLPLFNRVMRPIMRPLFRLLFHLLAEIQITGRENIPRRGAYLVAINHVSLYDPAFALAFWPKPLEAAGAIEIWSRPGQSLLVRLYGGIPVHRGQLDRQVIEKMTAALRTGRPLLIAPEGGRSHTPGMQRAYPGAAYLHEVTGVPVLPVGIVGTTDDFFQRAKRLERPRLEMHIGRPLQLPPVSGKGEARRRQRQRNADLIMLAIAALLPPEYQGIYGPGFDPETAPPFVSPRE